jgi:transcriptional regulator with XRE-family HTH domain
VSDTPSETYEDWVTTAAAIRKRRSILGLTQEQAARAANLGIQTWRNVESGREAERRDATLNAMETVLKWPHGTIRSIANLSIHRSPADNESRLQALEREQRVLNERLDEVTKRLAATFAGLYGDDGASPSDASRA